MAEKKTSTTVITPEARLSFPALFTPKSFEGQEARYSAVLIFKEGTDISALKKAVAEVAREKFGDKLDQLIKSGKFKSPFRDGAEKSDMDGFDDGSIFITATTKTRPGVIGRKKEDLDEDEIKAGDFVRASLNPFAYDRNGNRGVAFGLNNIQKIRTGEPLGGARRKAQDEFDEIEGDDEDYVNPFE